MDLTEMNSIEQNFTELLNDYFKRLDAVQISSEGTFTTEKDKERYETLFMYALRKYQAAVYHFDNVKRIIESYKAWVEELARKREADRPAEISLGSGQKVKIHLRTAVRSPAHRCVYELSAFLEALKSSLDFLATVSSYHLTGVSADSISTFMKIAKKGRSGPIVDEVASHHEWLQTLRDYRHHLVHRLVVVLEGGFQIDAIGDHVSKVFHPVVVPKKTPRYVPDTRSQREMVGWDLALGNPEDPAGGEIPEGLARIESWFIGEVGDKELYKYSVKVDPSPDYIPIEDFMASHLASYETFFRDILDRLESLNFSICNLR